MQFSVDPTGFPLVVLASGGPAIHLLPMTKVQAELLMGSTGSFGDTWYEEVLRLNPRTSWTRMNGVPHEGLILSGILPDEALDFARGLGAGFDLPTVAEWRQLGCILRSVEASDIARHLGAIGPVPCHSAARAIIEVRSHTVGCAQARKVSFVEDGFLEIVRDGRGFAGLGRPRAEFHPNCWEPLRGPAVRLVDTKQRLRYVGFRLIRRAWSP